MYNGRLSPYIGDNGYEYTTTTGKTFKITDDSYMCSTPSNIQPYNIETFNLKQGDVILLHLDKDVDLDTTKIILEQMRDLFPDNTVLVANEHILKGLTILRLPTPKTGEVNMFDEEISAPDFLNNWLKRSIDF